MAPELPVRVSRLGAPAGVLAQAYDESQSVDSVLNRMRLDECRNVAAKRSSKPAAELVKDFLGRDWSPQAYEQMLLDAAKSD